MFEGRAQHAASTNFRFVLILTMTSKKQFCFSSEKARGIMLALRTTTTSIWNIQLNQPSFLSFFFFNI